MHRTSLLQTGHLAVSLCRCLFLLQILWSLLKSWWSEDERDQVTQWEMDIMTIQDCSSGIYHVLHVTAGTKCHKLKASPSWIDESVTLHTFQSLVYQNVGNLYVYSTVNKSILLEKEHPSEKVTSLDCWVIWVGENLCSWNYMLLKKNLTVQ